MHLLINLLFLSGISLIALGWVLKFNTKNKVALEKPANKNTAAVMQSDQYRTVPYTERSSFEFIDQRTRSLPTSATTNLDQLAAEIRRYARTDLEKARAAYVWIAENIRYDDRAYNANRFPDYTPEYVFKHRTAVCEGYSVLFEALGKKLGLDVRKISGHVKGYGYREGERSSKSNHAWNVVNIDGRWKIMDSTWGSGHANNIGGRLVSQQKFDDYWFDVNPFEAIFNHFPEIDSFQLISPRVSSREYDRLPQINDHLFRLGFDARAILSLLVDNPRIKLVTCYSFDAPIRVVSAPYEQKLTKGSDVQLHFHAPGIPEMAIIDANDQWSIHKPDTSSVYAINYTPLRHGKLSVVFKPYQASRQYQTLLSYTVQ